ncbi:MAG TPA: GNAT family N-acetyltransferase [Thermoplasmata archaeon]|nr:GNAT family N-acetyltransferase [Thermoplasmata archaeon]
MDETQYRPREFLDRDFATLVTVSHRLNPERRHTEEELRHWDRALRATPLVYRTFIVEERATGVGVGFGELMTDPDEQDPHFLWVGVSVDPGHQGRGVGRFLAELLEAEARSAGTVGVRAMARTDRPRDLAFLERRGYRERRRNWQSRLDLPAPGYATLPRRADALARDGIEFTTLEHEGPDQREVRERVHTLFNAVLEDEPRIGSYTRSTYEHFVTLNFGGPGFLPDAFFLARKGDRYIGVSNLELLAAEPGVLHQVLTGTLREFRGRGIATELKRRTVEYAQDHGFRSIRTSNDSLNHPMWAINQKLGYRREVPRVLGEKVWTPRAI